MGRSFSSVGCHSYRCSGTSSTTGAGAATGAGAGTVARATSSTGTVDATGFLGGFFSSALTSAANAGSNFIFLAYSSEDRLSMSSNVSVIEFSSEIFVTMLRQRTPVPRTQSGMAASQDSPACRWLGRCTVEPVEYLQVVASAPRRTFQHPSRPHD